MIAIYTGGTEGQHDGIEIENIKTQEIDIAGGFDIVELYIRCAEGVRSTETRIGFKDNIDSRWEISKDKNLWETEIDIGEVLDKNIKFYLKATLSSGELEADDSRTSLKIKAKLKVV